MAEPIAVKIQRVIDYGPQFNQYHYALYLKLIDNNEILELPANKHIWVNLWISKKDTKLSNQLSQFAKQPNVNLNSHIIITKNNQFYNGRKLTLD